MVQVAVIGIDIGVDQVLVCGEWRCDEADGEAWNLQVPPLPAAGSASVPAKTVDSVAAERQILQARVTSDGYRQGYEGSKP